MAKQNPALDRFIREGIVKGIDSGEIPKSDYCEACRTKTELFGFVDGTDTLTKAIKAQTEPTKEARKQRKKQGAKSLKWDEDLSRAVIEQLEIQWACRDCKPKVGEAVFLIGPHNHIWGEPQRVLVKKDPTGRDWEGWDEDSPEGLQALREALLEAPVLTELRGQSADDAQEARGWRDNEKGFFEVRSVDPEVRRRRGYVQWTPHNLAPLREAWEDSDTTPGERGRLTRIGRQSGGGYIIPRFPPERLDLPPISAEIRPFGPVANRLPWDWAKFLHKTGKGHAERIDIHPDGDELFDDPDRVFFAIEGTIKSDAIFSQGEAVFSVPACWQWLTPEMGEFLDRYDLHDKPVIVVPDADWRQNLHVISAAIQCRAHLEGWGLKRVYIAAPPTGSDGKPLAGPYGPMKGVDDFLGAGHSLDEMEVIGRELPQAFYEWRAPGRSDGAATDAQLLRALSLVHGLPATQEQAELGFGEGARIHKLWGGEVYRSIKPIVQVFNRVNPRRSKPIEGKAVRKSLERLENAGAITILGGLEATEPTVKFSKKHKASESKLKKHRSKRWWYRRAYVEGEDWRYRPVITVAPKLRARDTKQILVGEIPLLEPQRA